MSYPRAECRRCWSLGKRTASCDPQIHPSKNFIFRFQVVHLSFGVLKIVFSGVVLAQLSKKPRAIKNGLLIVWLKGSAVNLRGGL